ncbi:MAG: iron-containing redox enzyme family protein [Nitrospirae bacterium]|nr:MAG: iron-containing redox enzyme family protein [Nitrospirota bacterium]
MKPLSSDQLRDKLLAIMDHKDHWAWKHFSGPQITKAQLETHFRQEYAVYVRDFPVFLSRIHGKNPPRPVRSELARNLYEEDTGGLSLGQSHPDLFLTMMLGLGFERAHFRDVSLIAESRAYREWLDKLTSEGDWLTALAVVTIFVEGSVQDRQEVLHPSPPKDAEQIEEIVRKHRLVHHHGVDSKYLDLIRVHLMIEPGHRQVAWKTVLAYATDAADQQLILDTMQEALAHWLRYRDGVARYCGLRK